MHGCGSQGGQHLSWIRNILCPPLEQQHSPSDSLGALCANLSAVLLGSPATLTVEALLGLGRGVLAGAARSALSCIPAAHLARLAVVAPACMHDAVHVISARSSVYQSQMVCKMHLWTQGQ